MSDITTDLENDLKTVYTKEGAFEPYEREAHPWLSNMPEATDGRLEGKEFVFRLPLSTSYSVGAPNEGGDWAKSRRRKSVNGKVGRAAIDATLTITVEAEAAGKGAGVYGKALLAEATEECMMNYYTLKNTYALGDGTGKLATVLSSVVASDVITLTGPEFGFLLRENMTIEFANQVVGGTVQDLGGGVLEAVIDSIDFLNHQINLNINVTVTAGWVIYLQGTYGKRFCNGLRNVIDDGDSGTSLFTIVRADNPKINASILDGGGALQDYSEELLRALLVQITQRSDLVPTSLWCNEGILSEHYRHTTPDRIFQVTGAGTPVYAIGANQEELTFTWRGKRLAFKTDRSLPTRSLYANYDPGWRKHPLVEEHWSEQGGRMLLPAPAAGGTTYRHVLIGNLLGIYNFSHRKMLATGALLNLRDRDLARDA